MKRITILITTLLLVLTLSGCDDFGSYADESTLELLEETIEDELLDDTTEEEFVDETVEDELLDDSTEEELVDEVIDLNEYSEIWGSVSALSTDLLTIESMLTYAIQDEYSAYAEYEYILANFDVTKPFSNIINAESSHIEMLIPLFEVYELEVPYNDAENHLLPVIDIADTFRTGVIAEVLNIDMYNLFLEQDLPDDIRETFIALRDASLKHLAAFEKNLAKYE